MKKILFILPDLIPGGAERIVINLINNLPRENFDCEILLLNYTNHSFASQLSASTKIYNLNFSKFRQLILNPISFIKVLNSSKPNIVFSAYGELNPFVVLFSIFFSKIKFIARETSIPSLRYNRFLLRAITKIFYKYYSKIIVQSDAMYKDLVYNFNLKESKIVIINNIIDTNFIEHQLNSMNMVPKNRDIISLIYVGSLSEHKGIIKIIKYFNLISVLNNKLRLIIVGDGPYKAHVIKEIQSSPFSSNITLKDWQINPYEIISNSDFLIIASDYEGFPNVGLEANFCGIPVLVSTQTKGGARELIVENINGFLIDLNSTNTFFLEKKLNPILIKEHILDNYSSAVIIKKYIHLFNNY
jgi:glycosyltransferase involved in cell wall biosynthesis